MYIKNSEIIPEILGTKVPDDLLDSLHRCLAPLANDTTCISISNLFPRLLLRSRLAGVPNPWIRLGPSFDESSLLRCLQTLPNRIAVALTPE